MLAWVGVDVDAGLVWVLVVWVLAWELVLL